MKARLLRVYPRKRAYDEETSRSPIWTINMFVDNPPTLAGSYALAVPIKFCLIVTYILSLCILCTKLILLCPVVVTYGVVLSSDSARFRLTEP